MPGVYDMVRPLLFRMDAEQAHKLTLSILKTGLAPKIAPVSDPALETVLWDRKFPNPVGLAGGFDKNAEVVGAMFGLGFGFVEAGTVTLRPQEGNPRPRVFRDPGSESVINAMGMPNGGMAAFKTNMEKFLGSKPRTKGLVGINIGMNKDQADPAKDYKVLIHNLAPLADYISVNISSPNTPGLRDQQKRENLLPLLASMMEDRAKACASAPPPLLIKLSPDMEAKQQEEIAPILLEAGIDGLILSNTTVSRPRNLPRDFAAQKGGLSGPPLRDLSTVAIRNFYRLTGGKLPIIGLGGISQATDAYEKIRAGASLVQLYTALVFRGPGVVQEINSGLLALLKRDGFARLADAVGADAPGADEHDGHRMGGKGQ
jgi:dihydroorotate dehydrogenase